MRRDFITGGSLPPEQWPPKVARSTKEAFGEYVDFEESEHGDWWVAVGAILALVVVGTILVGVLK